MKMNMKQNLTYGHPECPCKPSKYVLERSCENEIDSITNNLEELALGRTDKFCFPKNYGAFCKNHTISLDSYGTGIKMPYQSVDDWCFIDQEKCFSSNITYVKYNIAHDAYISRDTCHNQSRVKSYIDEHQRPHFDDNNKGKLITYPSPFVLDVLAFGFEYPFIYTDVNETITKFSSASGLKFSVEDENLRGVSIDYLREMIERTDIEGMLIRPTMEYYIQRYNQSRTDATQNAILHEHGHLAMVPMFSTSERLSIFSLTIPLYTSKVYLFESPKTHLEGLNPSLRKTFEPFSSWLCITVFFMLLVSGFASVRFASKKGSHKRWHKARKYLKGDLPLRRKSIILIQLGVGSIITAFVDCFQGGTEIDSEASNLSHKIMRVGFAFFCLILQSSYTANLATILSRRDIHGKTDSMSAAIARKKKICISRDLKDDTKNMYSNYTDFIPVDEPYLKNSIRYLEESKCDLIAAALSQIRMVNSTVLCDVNNPKIVTYDAFVRKVEVVLAVHTDYKKFFDQKIRQLTSEGINYLDVHETYKDDLTCSVFGNEQDSSTEALTFFDLYFPFALLALCIILGVCMKLTNGKRNPIFRSVYKDLDDQDRKKNKKKTLSVRASMKYRTMLEYKNRMEILTNHFSRLNNDFDVYLQDTIDNDDDFQHEDSFHSANSKEL